MRLCSALILFLFLAATAYAAPSIEFTQTRANLGEVKSTEKVEHIFEFTNKGDEELVILNVGSS